MPPCPWPGQKRFASPAERPIRLLSAILGVGLVLVACNVTEGSPDLPRPTLLVTSTTSTSAPTTTATQTTEVTANPCETAFCLDYHIDPAASWSDGDPVTAADFAHTVEIHQDPDLVDVTSGYDLIEKVEVVDDKKLRLSFGSPYGAWQSLFDRVYPDGEDLGDITGLPTSGPFDLVEWMVGDHVTIARSPDWWARTDPLSEARPGDVEEITFVFIEDLEEMAEALEDGDVDVISARPDVAMVQRLGTMEDISFTLAPGPFWEHIDIHHQDPTLSQRWVRRVLSLAIDRQKLLDRTLRLLDPAADPLDNVIFMANTVNYEPHFKDAHDPAGAEALLVDNGCERGVDGIYVCGSTPMSFVWASTNDDPARAAIFESVAEDLEAIGVEIVADFRSPSDFVTREFLFAGPDVWQMINFSWRARPDPMTANSTYYCGDAGELNVNRYCSEEVEATIRATETILDPSERAEAYNRADRLILDDLALIPLYQKPVVMAWNSELSGPEPNYTLSSDLWNVATWSGKDSIVVALPAEPTEIDPRSRGDDNANVILGALMYGAFGMNPSHVYLPVLVDSVEIVEGRG